MTDVPEGTMPDAGSFEGHSPAPAAAPVPAASPAPNPRTRGYSPARDAREATEAVRPQATPNRGPDGSQLFKFGDFELSDTEIKDLSRFKAEREVRKATLPQSPDGYELRLPDDFRPPAGAAQFQFKKDDAFLAQARQLAHDREIDQDTFSKFLGLYAGNRVAEETAIENARKGEIAKLGSMVSQRITSITTWANATLGAELGSSIGQMLHTAKQVEAFEKIINQFSRQGGSQFTQSGREQPEQTGKIPGYENMSFEQRRAAQMRLAIDQAGRPTQGPRR